MCPLIYNSKSVFIYFKLCLLSYSSVFSDCNITLQVTFKVFYVCLEYSTILKCQTKFFLLFFMALQFLENLGHLLTGGPTKFSKLKHI
jgi:hypothetical protein